MMNTTQLRIKKATFDLRWVTGYTSYVYFIIMGSTVNIKRRPDISHDLQEIKGLNGNATILFLW